jgi:hypothetical protein
VPTTDLRTASGELPRWGDAVQLFRDPALADRIGSDQLAVLRALGLIDVTFDGEPYALPEVLLGRVLRHRLTAAEIAGDHLEIDPDLTAFAVPMQRGLMSSTGHPLTVASSDVIGPPSAVRPTGRARRLLSGPPGWLVGIDPGQLVALQLLDATLLVVPTDVDGDTAPMAAILREDTSAPLGRIADAGIASQVLPIGPMVVGAMVRDDDLFTAEKPVAPLGEVLAAAGMPHAGQYLGGPDSPPVDDVVPVDVHPATVGIPPGVDDAMMARILEIGRVVARVGLGVDDPFDRLSRRAMLDALRDWQTVAALEGAAPEPGVRRLVGELVPGAPRAVRAALHHLQAVHHLCNGAPASALAEIEQALRTATEDAWPLHELALNLRMMAGDHAGVTELLRRLDADHPLQAVAEHLLHRSAADAGSRARELWARAAAYLELSRSADLVAHQAHALARAGLAAAHVPLELRSDDLLHDRAGLERTVLELGPLLPPDELDLLRRWTGIRRRWWTVIRVDDDVAELQDRAGTATVEVDLSCDCGCGDVVPVAAGWVLLARPLASDDGLWIPGGWMALGTEEEVDDLPDPTDLAELATWAARPAGLPAALRRAA